VQKLAAALRSVIAADKTEYDSLGVGFFRLEGSVKDNNGRDIPHTGKVGVVDFGDGGSPSMGLYSIIFPADGKGFTTATSIYPRMETGESVPLVTDSRGTSFTIKAGDIAKLRRETSLEKEFERRVGPEGMRPNHFTKLFK